MESDLRRQHQQQMSSGLSRYSSAPSSYLSSFVDGGGSGRVEHEQYFNGQSSSPETERIIARFMLEETPFDLQMGFMKREDEDLQQTTTKQSVFSPSSPVLYQNSSRLPFPTSNPPPSSSETEPSFASLVSSPANHRIASLNVNGSNLTRHRSSPAGFFVNMDIDKGKPPPPSSSPPSGKPSPCENRAYPNISMGSWDGREITHKRSRESDRTSFSGLSASEDIQRESETRSLPLLTTEVSAMERYLQFQDSVPCKIRAKRGMATHPRSIAERVRRTRISERMRKLQELVPNMDKQTSTADMLDLAVDYIKGLQKQVKTLVEARSSCCCTKSSLDSEG